MDKVEDFDFIFDNIVGGGNWWQWKMMMLMALSTWAGGYPVILHIFAAYKPGINLIKNVKKVQNATSFY